MKALSQYQSASNSGNGPFSIASSTEGEVGVAREPVQDLPLEGQEGERPVRLAEALGSIGEGPVMPSPMRRLALASTSCCGSRYSDTSMTLSIARTTCGMSASNRVQSKYSALSCPGEGSASG